MEDNDSYDEVAIATLDSPVSARASPRLRMQIPNIFDATRAGEDYNDVQMETSSQATAGQRVVAASALLHPHALREERWKIVATSCEVMSPT